MLSLADLADMLVDGRVKALPMIARERLSCSGAGDALGLPPLLPRRDVRVLERENMQLRALQPDV